MRPGFALLITLWLLVPLSLLFTGAAMSARTAGRQAMNIRAAAIEEAQADGAVATALFGLIGGSAAPVPGTSVHMEELSGLLNPNLASPALLGAVLVRLGLPPAQAERLADAIADWRTPGQVGRSGGAKAAAYRTAGRPYGPPGAPLETIAELRLVLGMTEPIFAALAPYLTLDTARSPDPALAPPLLRDAIVAAGGGGGGHDRAVRITAVASGPDGTAARRAIVQFAPSPEGRGWRLLDQLGTSSGQP